LFPTGVSRNVDERCLLTGNEGLKGLDRMVGLAIAREGKISDDAERRQQLYRIAAAP
jgi:hypothetical protein